MFADPGLLPGTIVDVLPSIIIKDSCPSCHYSFEFTIMEAAIVSAIPLPATCKPAPKEKTGHISTEYT